MDKIDQQLQDIELQLLRMENIFLTNTNTILLLLNQLNKNLTK
ncbi:hypothetical protein SDC9_15178 [bioreactor metagenome]|uniref:Uncharacterized protein n=1 Tax=bioreactor metagenome TaxID=1076179 RepID=A0A644TR24_9ZZZZ|nr:hypothetical protein [Desulfitobacterium hafniense]MEA5023930.1 hypothetical protein [Desulfitobacterium hafniense]